MMDLVIQKIMNSRVVLGLIFIQPLKLFLNSFVHLALILFEILETFDLPVLTLKQLIILLLNLLSQHHDLFEVLVCFQNSLVFAVRESDDLEIFDLKQKPKLFHKLEALLTQVCVLLEDHELLNGFHVHVGVEDQTN
jgi:hypothetical protein